MSCHCVPPYQLAPRVCPQASIAVTDNDWFGFVAEHPGIDEGRYIEAIEVEDPDQKGKGITEIVIYIREDLGATCAVLNL